LVVGSDIIGGDHMHGLIFVTWEKYLAERYGSSLLNAYRAVIGETAANSPLASRVYNDEILLAGLGVACDLTSLPANTLLREFGRYFIINGLTSHLCAYLLTRVNTARELLLVMSDAHAQMRRVPDGLTPPLFGYETRTNHKNELTMIYDSARKLCPVLYGAIEGAAQRYGETAQIVERACMKKGANVCRFDVSFSPNSTALRTSEDTPEQQARRRIQQQLADVVLVHLPEQDGFTLLELHRLMQGKPTSFGRLRLSILLEALRHLQYAGLVASTANQPGDDMTHRRYWRAPTS
jgi:Haem-NO-binding